MSEGSLPPFKYLDPRRYPAKLRDAAGRLAERFRRRGSRDAGSWTGPERAGDPSAAPAFPVRWAGDSTGTTHPEETGITAGGTSPAPEHAPEEREIGKADRERAESVLKAFLAENDTNVERAGRTRDQAERLEREGIPSDSARNRAERAREELVGGLAQVWRSLSSSGENGAARALELEATKLHPPVEPAEIRR